MTVFLLSTGSYSDYSVIAAFSTREAAEAVRARHPQSNALEEIELDPGVLHARDGYFRFHVEMDRDTGNVVRAPFEAYPDIDTIGTTVEESRRPPDGVVVGKWPPYEAWTPTLKVMCWARDVAHAIKIASERRREWLAKTPTDPVAPPEVK